MMRKPVLMVAAIVSVWLAASRPASADITAFVGMSGGPAVRSGWGLAAGFSLLVVGFEFEDANTSESLTDGAPQMRTVSGNLLVQTPIAVGGVQIYGTAGGGGYRQNLGTLTETNVSANIGGGVKVKLAGPLRLRADYRVFRLLGSPFGTNKVHRFYVGANLGF